MTCLEAGIFDFVGSSAWWIDGRNGILPQRERPEDCRLWSGGDADCAAFAVSNSGRVGGRAVAGEVVPRCGTEPVRMWDRLSRRSWETASWVRETASLVRRGCVVAGKKRAEDQRGLRCSNFDLRSWIFERASRKNGRGRGGLEIRPAAAGPSVQLVVIPVADAAGRRLPRAGRTSRWSARACRRSA